MNIKNWRLPTLLNSGQGGSGLAEVREDEANGLASGVWPTALLIAGSALLGAAAIGFWNRRTIQSMRTQIDREPESLATVSRNEEIL